MTTTEARPVTSQEATPAAGDRARWFALVTLLVAVFMDMLDGNVVSVAIPSIQRTLGASYSSIQWISAGYVLAFALMLITGGRLGDIYGRKRIFQTGVVGFVVASLLCGIAVNPEMLIASRLLQGAMAGLMVPQVLSIIHVTFSSGERGKVFAIYGIIGGLAATVAPLIGGVVVQADLFGLGWRPVFLMNVPIGILGLVAGWKFITESKKETKTRLDVFGVVLAMGFVVALLYPLTLGHELGWPAWTFWSIGGSVVLLVAFIAYERNKERKDYEPLVPLGLFKTRGFAAGNALQLGLFMFTGAFFLAWYLFMQLGLGWSALHAGLTALAFCIGAFITSGLSVTVLVQKFGRAVLQIGAVTTAIGLGVFLLVLSPEVSTWQMVLPLVIIGLGFGLVAPPITLFALTDVPHEHAGSASGVINTMQQLGLALGIAVVSFVFLTPLDSATGTTAEKFATAFEPALYSTLGLVAVILLLTFALPKRAAEEQLETPAAA
jgi:EmrB/QacA subfamily drug resistance transporter